MKKIKCIFAAVLLLTGSTCFAVVQPSMRERTGNWAKNSPGLRADSDGGFDLSDPPKEDPAGPGTPIGDALPLLVGLSLAYGVYAYRKRFTF